MQDDWSGGLSKHGRIDLEVILSVASHSRQLARGHHDCLGTSRLDELDLLEVGIADLTQAASRSEELIGSGT